ncbi:MAG: SpoIIE family protein phosphatase [Cyanobacteria bacterium]|nr:SpoIIE family protein phosphatase [Cyanobacteriota bacterium]MDW8201962.1 SpoIIE family protein phosphatase [Cyanobacteriota bacterium SKYGB_h_bin112]
MKLINPAVSLMNRLTYPQKFLLISLIFVLPIALLMQLLLSSIGDRIEFSQKELYGNSYLVSVRQVWEPALDRQYQASTNSKKFSSQRASDIQQQLERAITALAEVDRRYGKLLKTAKTYTKVMTAWQHLSATTTSPKTAQQTAYQEFIQALSNLRAYVGDTSNLILDPDLDTYYLMDASLLKLPELQRLLAELRLKSEAIQAYQTMDAQDRATLVTLAGLLQETKEDLVFNLTVGFQNNPTGNLRPRLTKPLTQFIAELDELVVVVNRLRNPQVNPELADYVGRASTTLALSFQLWDNVVTELDTLLQQRIHRFVQQRQLIVVGVIIVLLVVVYLFTGFYLAVMRTVYSLDQAAKQMATGDLTQPITLDNRDELGQVVHSFNMVAAALVQANKDIRLLNQQLEADNLRMATELAVTRQLQRMILPKEQELDAIQDLEIAGFMEPANEVGGDYYDVLQHNGIIKIGIGDVTGHGLESSVLMIMVQTAVRALLANNETDPVKFLSSLNRAIYDNVQRMNSDKNLTLALIDYDRGKLRLSGQHEEVIVARSSGGIERIDTIDLGFPIGLEENITSFISQAEVMLEVGDVVVLYTDGITEAENATGQFYGLERLCQVVQKYHTQSAKDIRQAIIADVQSFIGSHIQYDDITLLVLKRR